MFLERSMSDSGAWVNPDEKLQRLKDTVAARKLNISLAQYRQGLKIIEHTQKEFARIFSKRVRDSLSGGNANRAGERSNQLLIEGAGSNKIPWDSWNNYEKVSLNGQTYAQVGNRLYSKHAVDRLQPIGKRFGPYIYIYQGLNGKDYGRSIAPQYVEDVISSTQPEYQHRTGNYSHKLGDVEVIVNSQGAVVTILTYK